MQISIEHRPGNSAARVVLSPGESITAESGAMIAMSGDLRIETTTHARGSGSILKGLGRMLAGESFFLNHFTAGGRGGEVWLAETLSGDMLAHRIEGKSLVVQAGSFVACEDSLDLTVGWQGFKNFLSGESLFWLNVKGTGTVVLGAFGCVYPVEVDGDLIVDTGHIVAFEETLTYSLGKAGESWLGSFLGGEGIVCRFKGKGTVWCQSHSPTAFGRLLGGMLPPRKG